MVTLDIAKFREYFPEFSDPDIYSDSEIEFVYDTATCYINDKYNYEVSDKCLTQLVYLMLAHLLKISSEIKSGNGSDFVISASEGSVSSSVLAPPAQDQWHWWLNTTVYGQQVLALLEVSSVGGFYVNGSAEIAGFRKGGGIF